MNMMSQTEFTGLARTATARATQAVHGPDMTGAAQDFALLLAIAAARQLQNPVIRNLQMHVNRTDTGHRDNRMPGDGPILQSQSHAHDILHIVCGNHDRTPAFDQYSAAQVTSSFAPPSWFGNVCESSVYHGVSNKFQTLAVNTEHQDANPGSPTSGARIYLEKCRV